MSVPSSRFEKKNIYMVFKGGYNIILLCVSAVCEVTVMRNKQIIIWTVSELHEITF